MGYRIVVWSVKAPEKLIILDCVLKMIEKTLYKKIDPKTRLRMNALLNHSFEQVALGTIDEKQWPLVTKVIPLVIKNNVYMLLSDLSDHTKNVIVNPMASLYFAAKEHHQTRSNNARLTLQGTVTKLSLDKRSREFELFVENHSKFDKGLDMWAYFEDFNYYEFETKRRLYVEGFAKAYEEIIR